MPMSDDQILQDRKSTNPDSKVMLITGASRGIGAATARLAASHGYDVVINYHSNLMAAKEVVAEVEAAGQRAIAVQGDMASKDDIFALFKACDGFGTLSVLVNNAGILMQQGRLQDMEPERFHSILQTNVFGPLLCCREAIRRMSSENGGEGGAIINVSSGAAKSGSPNEYVDYAASKGALDTLTIGLAKEVASQGIRVLGVRPGFINTDIHASGGEPGRVERLKSRIPLGRGGEPEEVAEAILWLASDRASYSTGAILDLLGGV